MGIAGSHIKPSFQAQCVCAWNFISKAVLVFSETHLLHNLSARAAACAALSVCLLTHLVCVMWRPAWAAGGLQLST
jgi:hypothetical protein